MAKLTSYSLLFVLFLTACSPKASVSLVSSLPQNWDDERIILLDVGTDIPPDAQKLGVVTADNEGFISEPGYYNVLHVAAEETWKAGGNVLHLNENREEKFFSLQNDFSRVSGDILYVPGIDSLTSGKELSVWHPVMPPTEKRWEISLGISGPPNYAYELKPLGFESETEDGPQSATMLYDNSYSAKTSGFVVMQGAYRFHKRWAAIGSLGYSHLDVKRVNPATQDVTGYESADILTAMIGMRYYYIARPLFRMYGAVQMGLYTHFGHTDYWNQLSNPDRCLGAQATFIGLQFGREWFGELEVYGFGDYYSMILPPLGGRIGFGYRF